METSDVETIEAESNGVETNGVETNDVGITDALKHLKHLMKPAKKKLSGLIKHLHGSAVVPGPELSIGDVTAQMDGAALQCDPEAKADFRQAIEVMRFVTQLVYVFIFIKKCGSTS